MRDISSTKRPPKTHAEMSAKAPRPCAAHDLTFGGRCLNCGFGGEAPKLVRIP